LPTAASDREAADRQASPASSITEITAICIGFSASAEIGCFVSTMCAAQCAAVAR
jgi:hypothetical protein